MGGEERGEDERLDSHKLDEDVEGWARCVLEWVSNGVTDHSSLVAIRTLGPEAHCVLRSTSLNIRSSWVSV